MSRPVRPPRPRLRPSQGHIAVGRDPHTDDHTQGRDLADLRSPLTSSCAAQTDQQDQPSAAVDVATSTSSHAPLERPRPRPRSRVSVGPISSEVKVQTLVKLREDGLATLAACAGNDTSNRTVSQGTYLQELLEAFSSDDWGLSDHHGDSSGLSQSESEEEEEANGEDMATLKARMEVFEQQRAAEGSSGDGTRGSGTNQGSVVANRPEPRPRLQGQTAKSVPPMVAPKPKSFLPAPKPSNKVFWEDGCPMLDSGGLEAADIRQTDAEPASAPVLVPQPYTPPEKPLVAPKPQSNADTLPSSAPACSPVPAPRPPQPKPTPSLSQTQCSAKPPPRPLVAPRTSTGPPHQDKTTTTPSLPPRPSAEASGAQTDTQDGTDETQETVNQTGECRSLLTPAGSVLEIQTTPD